MQRCGPSKARFDVLYPAGRHPRAQDRARIPLGLITVPAARVYAAASGLVRAARLRHRVSITSDAVIISIGNLELGGNGKTPLAIHIIRRLASRGYRPVYVSRGFRSEAERMDGVSVVHWERLPSPASAQTAVRYVRHDAPRLSRVIGDEGAMVAARCPTTPLFFCRDRSRAVHAALEMGSPTHVILDDAFQTWSMPRDIDIVLLDAESPLGNGRVVPAGSLREAPSALARADMVGINGCDGTELDRWRAWVESAAGRALPVFGLSRSITFLQGETGARQDDMEGLDGPVVSLSSLARPERFDRALIARGLNLVLAIRYPDHYRYRTEDLHDIGALVRQRGARVVTTEKDWAKLRDHPLPCSGVSVARLEVSVEPEEVLAKIERPRGLPAAVSNAAVS
jgi:tetraacyldisaccharide 4'-kinase